MTFYPGISVKTPETSRFSKDQKFLFTKLPEILLYLNVARGQNFSWRNRGRSKTGARSSRELEGLTMKMSQHDHSISRAEYEPVPSGADSLHFYRASKTPPPSKLNAFKTHRRLQLPN